VAFSGADLDRLTHEVVSAWRAGSERDWSVRAGTLEWNCTETADHAVDVVLAPAFFLASRKQDAYPGFGVFSLGPTATPAALIEALETASRILGAVVAAAPSDARAVIWRRPQVETRGPEDFVPGGALELVLHAHDVCRGLGVPFVPSVDLCDRLRRHTQSWPMWHLPYAWQPLAMTGDPWTDLLVASGRNAD